MRSFRFFLILAFFLGSGYILGKLFKHPSDGYQNVEKGQENVLVFIIDYTATQKLQGVWLATFDTERAYIHFFPFYPYFLDPKSQTLETRIQKSFELEKNNLPKNSFFKMIGQEYNVNWEGYVMIDDTGILKTIDEMGGIEVDGEHLDGYSYTIEWPPVSENPETNYQFQARLIETFCMKVVDGNFNSFNLENVLKGKGKHIVTDIDVVDIINAFGALASKPEITCKIMAQESSSP